MHVRASLLHASAREQLPFCVPWDAHISNHDSWSATCLVTFCRSRMVKWVISVCPGRPYHQFASKSLWGGLGASYCLVARCDPSTADEQQRCKIEAHREVEVTTMAPRPCTIRPITITSSERPHHAVQQPQHVMRAGTITSAPQARPHRVAVVTSRFPLPPGVDEGDGERDVLSCLQCGSRSCNCPRPVCDGSSET
jgi:hypothetical protein